VSLLLTADELEALTGYKLAAYQRKWLTARGWAFELSASGKPRVLRAHAEERLGGKRREWKPDFSGLVT
jgi:hypothetical protein